MPTLAPDGTPTLSSTAKMAVDALKEAGRPELAALAEKSWLEDKEWKPKARLPQNIVRKIYWANYWIGMSARSKLG